MKLSGVLPALVTPFDDSGKIDFGAFERLLTYLRAAGVTGWVPCGSTGGNLPWREDRTRRAANKRATPGRLPRIPCSVAKIPCYAN